MNSYDTYYPRPQLKRDSFFSLNGERILNSKPINVPFPPESKLSDYQGELGDLDYKKSFTLPENFYGENDKVILHFGAVDMITDVYLNGFYVYHNEGGYLPFSIDITEYLKEENNLEVIIILMASNPRIRPVCGTHRSPESGNPSGSKLIRKTVSMT